MSSVLRRLNLVLLAIIIPIAVAAITYLFFQLKTIDQKEPISKFDNCIESRIKYIGENVNFSSLSALDNVCSKKIYSELWLNDFEIRRLKYKSQFDSDPLILYMVIFITFSGVVMAGYQLYLAQNVSVNEINIESGNKISFKSSIVGVVILFISLGFFIVYVKYIYPISEVSVDKNIPALENREKKGEGPKLEN